MKSPVEGAHLCTYVPKTLIKRFGNENDIVLVPEETWTHGAVLFADISGFTPLTERMSKEGLKGIEMLSAILNDFFDKLIQIIHQHGGDIIKFAGDALMALWTAPISKSLGPQVVLAAQCALKMLEDMKGYNAGGCALTLHSGIGAGQISHLHVGGTGSRLEYLISGHFIDQVSECEKRAESGQVYISHNAFSIAAGYFHPKIFTLFITKKSRSKKKRPQDVDTCYLLTKVKQEVVYPTEDKVQITKSIVEKVKSYCPAAIKCSDTAVFIAENRIISVLFVNLDLVYVSGQQNLEQLQRGIIAMQQEIYKYRGEVRQFIVDDKGSVLIGVFGLPPESHEDDAVRAVLAASAISKELGSCSIQSRIGVTTGNAFCGDVGNDVRREYAMVGDIVNLSARLMGACQWGQVMCDDPTYKANMAIQRGGKKTEIIFDTHVPIKVKGKTEPIQVYNLRSGGVERKTIRKESHQMGISTRVGIKNLSMSSSKLAVQFIGRQKELESIMLIVEHIAAGTWHTFCISEEKRLYFSASMQSSSEPSLLTHRRKPSGSAVTPLRPAMTSPEGIPIPNALPSKQPSRPMASTPDAFPPVNTGGNSARNERKQRRTSGHRFPKNDVRIPETIMLEEKTPDEHPLAQSVDFPTASLMRDAVKASNSSPHLGRLIRRDNVSGQAPVSLLVTEHGPTSTPPPTATPPLERNNNTNTLTGSERPTRPARALPKLKMKDLPQGLPEREESDGSLGSLGEVAMALSPTLSRIIEHQLHTSPRLQHEKERERERDVGPRLDPSQSDVDRELTTKSTQSMEVDLEDTKPEPKTIDDTAASANGDLAEDPMTPRGMHRKRSKSSNNLADTLAFSDKETLASRIARSSDSSPHILKKTPSGVGLNLRQALQDITPIVPPLALNSSGKKELKPGQSPRPKTSHRVQTSKTMQSPRTGAGSEPVSLAASPGSTPPVSPRDKEKPELSSPRKAHEHRSSPRSRVAKGAELRISAPTQDLRLFQLNPPTDATSASTEADSQSISERERGGEALAVIRSDRRKSDRSPERHQKHQEREKEVNPIATSDPFSSESPSEAEDTASGDVQFRSKRSASASGLLLPKKNEVVHDSDGTDKTTATNPKERDLTDINVTNPTILKDRHIRTHGAQTHRVRGTSAEHEAQDGKHASKTSKIHAGTGSNWRGIKPIDKFMATYTHQGKKEALRNSAFLVLKGEAGFGKTSLMGRVISNLRKKYPDFVILQSSCDSIEERTPYFPWREIFGTFLNCIDVSMQQISQAKLEIIDKLEGIKQGMGNYVALLNAVIPLDWKELSEVSELTEGDKISIREKLLLSLLTQESRKLLIFIDNAQWMDSCSWRLVEEILNKADNILVVFALRPMHPIPLILSRLVFKPNAAVLELPGFDESEIMLVIKAVLSVETIPQALEKHLASKNLQSPLLAKEFAYELMATNAVDMKGNKVELTETGWNMIRTKEVSKVPVTLKLMLTSRIDRLQPHQKLILKEAAVIGFNFLFPILKSIHYFVQHSLVSADASSDRRKLTRHNTVMLKNHFKAAEEVEQNAEGEIHEALQQLVESELIECTNFENLAYSFKNSLTRDIVYDLILFKDKIVIHKAVYVWYERTYENDSDISPYLTVIAHHALQSGNIEKAIMYYSKAAQNAIATGAFQEAIQYLEEALKIDKNELGKQSSPSDQSETVDNATKEYRMLQVHRLLAQCYFNIGILESCILHLTSALQIMDISTGDEVASETAFPAAAIAFNTPLLNCSRLCSSIRKNALNEVISHLLNERVSEFINMVNENGKTPLFVACKKGNVDILIELLNSPGINPNMQNDDGKTAIQASCASGNLIAVALLLAHGANPTCVNKSEMISKKLKPVVDMITSYEAEGLDFLKKEYPIVIQSLDRMHSLNKRPDASSRKLLPGFQKKIKEKGKEKSAVARKDMATTKKTRALSPKALRYTGDIVACMVMLSKVYYYNCNNTLAMHYCISALNFSLMYNLNTFIYKSLVCCLIVASSNGELDVVKEYAKILIGSSEEMDVLRYRAMHESSVGLWNDSTSRFKSAFEHSRTKIDNNIHERNELKYFNEMNRFLVGDYSLTSLGAMASIISTGDIQFQALSLVATAQMYYQDRSKQKFFNTLDQLHEFETLTANLDVCAIISIQAMLLQSTFVKYHKDSAFQKISKLSKLISKTKPKTYFLLNSLVVMPLTLFGWILILRPGDMVRQLRALLDTVLADFEEYSRCSPLAVPYMHLWTYLKGVIDGSEPNIKRVVDSASRLGLTGLVRMCAWWEVRVHEAQFLQSLAREEKRSEASSQITCGFSDTIGLGGSSSLGLVDEVDEEDILWSLYNLSPKSKYESGK